MRFVKMAAMFIVYIISAIEGCFGRLGLILLQVVFITLQVSNVINWNWWLVFIPMFVYIAISIFIITLEIMMID